MLKDRNPTGFICRLATASIEQHDTIALINWLGYPRSIYSPNELALVYLFDAELYLLDTLTTIFIYVICVIRT